MSKIGKTASANAWFGEHVKRQTVTPLLFLWSFTQQMVHTAAFVTVTWTIPANGQENDQAFVSQMTTL